MEEKNLQARAQRLRTAQKQRRRWRGMVSALAAIVVLLTACWLTLPAVTMTRGAIAVEAEKESAVPGEQISGPVDKITHSRGIYGILEEKQRR